MLPGELKFLFGLFDLVDEVLAFGGWLASRSRDRSDAQSERAALQPQADAYVLAIAELQAATNANHVLWEGSAERRRVFLLTSLATLGGYARARLASRGAPEWLYALASLGDGARMLSHERLGPKKAAAALTAHLTQIAAAAGPLLRHPNPDVAATTDCLLTAVQRNAEHLELLDEPLEAFRQAIRAAHAPPPAPASPPPAAPQRVRAASHREEGPQAPVCGACRW
ncbi:MULTISPECIES: hypothetical protein [Streptomyces]|uniref:hypothetical protein n=1 Tax=Streptomyces TaxID=1883 RepID=UPI00345B803D